MDTYRKSAAPSAADDTMAVNAAAPYRIRPVGWRDWRELEGLFRRIFPELTPEVISHYIRHHDQTIAVAETSEGLVGFYHFMPRPEAGTAWLNYLGVISTRTHDGIGTRLLRHFEGQAAQMGLGQAEFDVLQQNDRAIRFYTKHGYARLYPVRDKFRYGKSLADESTVVSAALPRKRAFLSRVGRRALYLLLVTLPRRRDKA